MRKSKFRPYTLPSIEITNAGSEGKCIAREGEKVLMIDYGVPGDIADLRIYGQKKRFSFAAIEQLVKPSPDRIDTFCSHFGTCGGCKWQQMSYDAQLRYKHQQVKDAFERIGKFQFPEILPTLGSERQTFYRNKLEYSFTHQKWLTDLSMKDELTEADHAGLGFHIPGRFDKVFDVEKCWLMDDLQNRIRNEIKRYCIAHKLPFFNLYGKEGLMRSLIMRNTLAGEWMVIVVFANDHQPEIREGLMNHLQEQFTEITSLLYVINPKANDTIFDLEVHVHHGKDHLIEQLENLKYKIGPKSFFQTNSLQTLALYKTARDFAGLTGKEHIYDLYTGVGTIALFMAHQAQKVTGIEYIASAIEDAKENAKLNGLDHLNFFAGDMKDILTHEFIRQEGNPDVIITDPPRAGMHEDVIMRINEIRPEKVVYVSCNPATQARDIALMQEHFSVTRVQPVDMFPHTHHVENVVLLERK